MRNHDQSERTTDRTGSDAVLRTSGCFNPSISIDSLSVVKRNDVQDNALVLTLAIMIAVG